MDLSVGFHVEVSACDFELSFECVEAVEDPVVKSSLARLVPRMFDRIEFGCEARQTRQPHVVRRCPDTP